MANNEKPKATLKDESMAIFISGQIMGLMGMLNITALDQFVNSQRAQPTGDPDDFRYLKECKEIVKFHRSLFPNRKR